MSPKISVIIPVYNVEKYISKCIDSILTQTYPNIEIILVNDGSTDKSGQICESYKSQNENIKVIHQQNSGVSVARNVGMSNADGDLIGFVDADDYIDDDMYEFLFECIKKHDASVAQCGAYDEEENGRYHIRYKEFSNVYEKDDIILNYMKGNIARIGCNKLYRREAIGNIRFNTNYAVSEDLMFNFYIMKNISKVVVNNVPKYHYIRRRSSVMNKSLQGVHFQHIEVLKVLMSEEKDSFLMPYFKNAISEQALWLLNRIIISNEYTEQYELMRNYVVSNIGHFLKSNTIGKKIKFQIILLKIWPKMYNAYIKSRNKDSEKNERSK